MNDLFAKRLKIEREKKKNINSKWTQGYIADAIGVARPTYTAYESGTKQPPLETVNRIADLLEVSTDYLLGRTANPDPEQYKSNNFAYYGGGDDLTEDEKEVARIAIEAYRRGKKAQKENNED
jgi:transcriptional regulator with XRE-family HTH domain